jgi:hypothetical protein
MPKSSKPSHRKNTLRRKPQNDIAEMRKRGSKQPRKSARSRKSSRKSSRSKR